MFDLTKEVSLSSKSYSIYRKLQLAIYGLAFVFTAYFSYLVLFPHKIFLFSFINQKADSNTIDTPVINGRMPNMTFSTVLLDYYSRATIALNISDTNNKIPQISASVRKAYRAFFDDLAQPIGFKDGTLIKNNSNYYIVSDGFLRKFSQSSVATQMGYPVENFLEVEQDELKYNPIGININAGEAYPDATLFNIGESYYILMSGKLTPFSSQNAFKSQYDFRQAIKKDADFLNQYPVSKNPVGFADGTLVSNGDSALIISDGNIYPIDNAQTFLAKGYDWNSIFPATSAEVSMYNRTRLFNINDIQPTGTIYRTVEDNRFYMIKDSKKHPLPSAKIADSWKITPVLVTQKSLEITQTCDLTKSSIFGNTYSCIIPLDAFSGLYGNEYEIKLKSADEFNADLVSVDYKKNTDGQNLRMALSGIFNRIKLNYGLVPMENQ